MSRRSPPIGSANGRRSPNARSSPNSRRPASMSVLSRSISPPPSRRRPVRTITSPDLRERHKCIVQAWGAVEPAKGHDAIDEVAPRGQRSQHARLPLPSDHAALLGRRSALLPAVRGDRRARCPRDDRCRHDRHGRGHARAAWAPRRATRIPHRSMRSPPTSPRSRSSWRIRATPGSTRRRRSRSTRAMSFGRCRAGRRNICRPRSCATCAAGCQDKMMFGSDYPSIPYDAPVQGMGRARFFRCVPGKILSRQRRTHPRPLKC